MKSNFYGILLFGILFSCGKNHKPDVVHHYNEKELDSLAWTYLIDCAKPEKGNKDPNSLTWDHWAYSPDQIYGKPVTEDNVYSLTQQDREWSNIIKGNIDINDFEKFKTEEIIFKNAQRSANPNQVTFNEDFVLKDRHKIDSVREEVRVNETLFNSIIKNNVYTVEGQEEYAKAGKDIEMDNGSFILKAHWSEWGFEQKRKNLSLENYIYKQDKKGKYWVLVALHITRKDKDFKNWFWATFEHIDNYKLDKTKMQDQFGITGNKVSAALENLLTKNGLNFSVWKNYRLIGVQTDFNTRKILANSVIEENFVETSSCITCHSRATIGNSLETKDVQDIVDYVKKENSSGIFAKKGEVGFDFSKKDRYIFEQYANRLNVMKIDGINVTGYVGDEDKAWFYKDQDTTKQKIYFKTDYLWSLANAKRKKYPRYHLQF